MKYTSKSYAKEILKDIKKKKIIRRKRDKNLDFIKKYNIKQRDIEEIIFGLTENIFKGKLKNEDKSIKAEYLYYFKTIVNLSDEFGEINKYIYIKICEVEENVLVVSIHEDE